MRPLARLSAAALTAGLAVALVGPMTPAGAASGQRTASPLTATATVGAVTTDDTTATDDTAVPDKASRATFWVDTQEITEFTKVPAGSILKIKAVPGGSTVSVFNFKDPGETFDVAPTKQLTTWRTQALPPATRIQVVVSANDGSRKRINFATQAAENTFTVSVAPSGGTYGTGMPLVVNLGVGIPDKDKAAVESAMTVVSTKDYGQGSWHWMSSTQMVFRPRDYWPGNAKITVRADLRRFQVGDYWGPQVDSSWHTGDAVLMKVNLRKHTMDFYRNGKLQQQFAISGGMSGHETASGVKVIETKERNRWLTNPDPVGGWHVKVAYAMRVTDDAEFIHSAPWNYNLGYANTSHGCTNMSVNDSAWVFRNVLIGDPVEYTGTGIKVPTSNYLSGYWNYTWVDWKAGSALAKNR